MSIPPLDRLLRYGETVRHLRPEQVYRRIWFRLSRPVPDLRPAPACRERTGPWQPPACRRPSLIGDGAFLFLGEHGTLDRGGWDDPDRDKLWRYNQHYFDDLNAVDAAARAGWHRSLITRWISENPPGKGTGWEPYPASLRIVNWIKWLLACNTAPAGMLDSLAVQARWLSRRQEYHLLGNHLFANAKALVFAGLWFDGREADSWLEQGLAILSREFDEQVLPDGGQFELSPMYHALALEDVLDVANIASAFSDALDPAQAIHWRARVPAMAGWLSAMSHPDGNIAFFNDAAFGITPDNGELCAYAQRLGLHGPAVEKGPVWLRDSGYVRLETGDAVLIADMARIGPDYLPGHAHADTLSCELSLFGTRVIVNSGTSLYGTGPERQRQRGTPAHSTLNIAGENSSDVWSGFRVGRRARIIDTDTALVGERQWAHAIHDGYRYRPGKPRHQRRWTLDATTLTIEDTLTAPAGNPADVIYHVHPDVSVEQEDETHGTLTMPGGKRARWQAAGGNVRIERSSWHPEFGSSLASQRLVLVLVNGQARFELTWE